MTKMMRFYFWDIGKVKGPQICSISYGFLKIEIIIEQFNTSLIIYVLGFMSELFFGIFDLLLTFKKNKNAESINLYNTK